ncbi:MAG: peptide chain release factor 2 [SAR324 cluster bacterium]|nr:peptide chain release factor 2 [SAR324 cluster bacterium]
MKDVTSLNDLTDLKIRRLRLKDFLKIDKKAQQLSALEFLTTQADFWQDTPQKQAKILKEKSEVSKIITDYEQLLNLEDEIKAAFELSADSASDSDLYLQIKQELASNSIKYQKSLDKLELVHLLSGEQDSAPALLTINSGAGGVEAMDWVVMLLRMYKRWSDKSEYKSELIDAQPGEETGYKSVLLKIKGYKAYGLLKREIGVHRLVRISPFDMAKRRHTSFASVFVSPEIDDQIKININDSDLRIDTLRASKAGGQHVNTTDSAVRITHLPSGIVVKVQNERSQHKNRSLAMKILRSHLYQKEVDEKKMAQNAEHQTKDNIDFGRQIRSYVLYPYQMVKDHKSNYETASAQAVLDGEIDEFIGAAMRIDNE